MQTLRQLLFHLILDMIVVATESVLTYAAQRMHSVRGRPLEISQLQLGQGVSRGMASVSMREMLLGGLSALHSGDRC